MSHFFISGIRSKLGGMPVINICREPDERYPKEHTEAAVFYSDRAPGDHVEAYRLAQAMVRGLNEFYGTGNDNPTEEALADSLGAPGG